MNKNKIAEVILVDEKDQAIGTAEKLAAHQHHWLHRAFSVFILRKTNTGVELLLQQRALDKYHSGGLWANTCCSHPRPQENIIEAGERRLKEELGLAASLDNIGHFHYYACFDNGLAENEIDHVLVGWVNADTKINVDPGEINAYRWISPAALKNELILYPYQFVVWLKPALDFLIHQQIF